MMKPPRFGIRTLGMVAGLIVSVSSMSAFPILPDHVGAVREPSIVFTEAQRELPNFLYRRRPENLFWGLNGDLQGRSASLKGG